MIHKLDDLNSIDPNTQVFGEAEKEKDPIRIVYDSTTGSFMLLFIKDCKVEMRGVDKESFKQNFPKFFDSLEEWMQEFFGLKTLFTFIYDGTKNIYVKENIELLKNLTSDFRRALA